MKQLKLNEYDGRQVVFTSVYGSHNYGTNDETSDIDYKIFVMPTLEDLYTGDMFAIATKLDGNDLEVHDIRKLPSLLNKSNPSYLEVIQSEWIWANEGFEEYVKFLVDNKFEIGQSNKLGLYNAMIGIMQQKRYAIIKVLPNKESSEGFKRKQLYGYDTKQLMHFCRMLWMMFDIFVHGHSIMDVFKRNEKDILELKDIKNNKSLLINLNKPIDVIVSDMQRAMGQLPEKPDNHIDTKWQEKLFEETKKIVLDKVVKKEIK